MNLSEQTELALARKPLGIAVPVEIVRAKKTAAAAITLACDASGLEDKEIYLALNIDAGYFSNIKKGKATLQADLIAEFCRVVGNTVYPEWLAYQLGSTLVMIESEAERRARKSHERAEKLAAENQLMRELLQGRVAA